MLDTSFLPPADLEFVVLADTHYMVASSEVEFDSRRLHSARIEHAIARINAFEPDFVVHLGDVVQAFPESAEFDRSMREARHQLDRLDAPCHFVPGNHDVGDKHDPTMPTAPVTEESLEAYHERFGRSWYRWNAGGIECVAMNSQILGSTLPAAEVQRIWIEETLTDRGGDQIFLFLHLPPFIDNPDEPSLGHYDTIAKPGRDWLIDLIRDTSVSHVFSAHTHFQFRNRIDETAFHVLPSPAFTRPGFSELFAACPPPERGRDDRPKLGFYVVRVRNTVPSFYFVRTNGAIETDARDLAPSVLTLPTARLPHSRLGVSLVHAFVESGIVPATFPSAIQQPVHDDYPLLACLELGANVLRVPHRDGDRSAPTDANLKSFQRRGGHLIGTILRSDDDMCAREIAPTGLFDELELRLAGRVIPSADTIEALTSYRESIPVPIGLSIVVPGRSVPGKQHTRPRKGYRPDELARVDDALASNGATVDRVVCDVDPPSDPWTTFREAPGPHAFSSIGAIDWVLSAVDVPEATAIDRLCRAMGAVSLLPRSRLYLEPLRSLDRTMDAAVGLLDRRRNPTDAFHVARHLNTILFTGNATWQSGRAADVACGEMLHLTCDERHVSLILPDKSDETISCEFSLPARASPSDRVKQFTLTRGTSTILTPPTDGERTRDLRVNGPTVVQFE